LPSSGQQPTPSELLTKVLVLELEQGCTNKAAIGGLESLVDTWRSQFLASADESTATDLQGLIDRFAGYDELAATDRRQLVKQMLQKIPAAAACADHPESTSDDELHWDTPVTSLDGVGPTRARILSNLAIYTIGDLLLHCPIRYEDRSQLTPLADAKHRETATVRVRVTGPGRAVRAKRIKFAQVPVADDTAAGKLFWFNQTFRANLYPPGTEMIATGKVRIQKGKVSLAVTEEEVLDEGEIIHSGRLVPMYPLTQGISAVMIRKLIHQALQHCPQIPLGAVPPSLQTARKLPPLEEAVREVHFPETKAGAQRARRRLAYEELFTLQAALAQRRRRIKRPTKRATIPTDGIDEQLQQGLAFELTDAQRRTISQVLGDLAAPEPAYRLIHGDVGSGKTVVAAAAVLAAVQQGRQAAMMAPTEILAEQDWAVLSDILAGLGLQPALLVGSRSEDAKTQIRQQLATGELKLVVGTHALFQQSVEFADLAVVVIDEQHRFGVAQRARMAGKGKHTNILVMSATPIPRTLALTAYGDFDISVLDELPPGRKPVHTQVIIGDNHEGAYKSIIANAKKGRQAYIVCPVIQESKQQYLTAAEQLFQRLKNHIFPTLRLGLVHGQMPADQRETTMEAFREGNLDVLVATSVIEVGVDVPNAVVMMVENAERFGLSQLHQLRGRVGRSHHQAYCLLLTTSRTPEVIDRLKALERTTDGFEIAREDLRRRGPGELTGTRQHGLPDVRMADLMADTATLAEAREDAFALIAADPQLQQPEHQPLQRRLQQLSRQNQAWTL